MAKILYAYSRRRPFARSDERKLREICRRLEPDNLAAPPSHTVMLRGALACAVMNDRGALIEEGNVLLGCLYGNDPGWARAGAEAPDGSYAIFRSGNDRVELLSDAAASRTIWYYLDDEYFVASTSQRAIVMFLGSFEFDPRVIPWMLSSGALGPGLAWDRRIRSVPADASVVLDKRRWTVSVAAREPVFSPQSLPRAEHRARLTREIRAVMQSLRRAGRIFDDYVLPLSGGYDSRAILCFLSEGAAPANLRTVTWGLERNADREGNDAAVARQLAAKVGVKHRYFHTDLGAEPVAKILDRFVQCGEGRVDHLSAYMDGLETWRRLLEEEGASGIIRGDEGFGARNPVSSELTVRRNAGLALCTDYRNLERLARECSLPGQALPAALGRRRGESLDGWRDRLFHAYRIPAVLAALTDVKCSYVEVINPLLARSILQRVRQLPERLRTDKALFKEIVESVSPEVPYAREGANADPAALLRKKELVERMRSELRSEGAQRILGRELLDEVLAGMRVEGGSRRPPRGKIPRSIRALVPRSVKGWIQDFIAKPDLDGNVLAFRAFLILRMHRMLESDRAIDLAAPPAAASTNAAAGARYASHH